MTIWLPTENEIAEAPELAVLAPLDTALHVATMALLLAERRDYDLLNGRDTPAFQLGRSIATIADALRRCLAEYRVARRAQSARFGNDSGKSNAVPAADAP
jgi:hypothetical protein